MFDTQRAFLLLTVFLFISPQATAAEKDMVVSSGYDARIRKEASLPAGWFTCKTANDCVLIYVPCSRSIAVNVNHKIEAQHAISKTERSQRCLGNALDTSLAACEAGHCVTKQKPFP